MMQSGVRAVESYRRSHLVDSATLDEDKVTPVYLLEEICDLLRSSPANIVKEVAEFIFKRLEHKSPIVKQKTLRLIKYSTAKSGSEFRREMQRQSGAIRNLFHYKGQPDPLKGDALNKAVRDTAHETVAAIFASDEKTSPMEDVSKRIQGFGSTNFDAILESKDKKTMLGEVMSIGSASIRQGLSVISNHYRGGTTGSSTHSLGSSYQAPDLRLSMSDRDNFDSYRESYRESSSYEHHDHKYGQYSVDHRSSDDDNTRVSAHDFVDPVSDGMQPNRAEILVDKVAVVGGVRLHPSRDTIHTFILEAKKLDPMFLHQALEAKLQAHSWQVRFKVLSLLEAIIRQKNNEIFGIVTKLFEDNYTVVENCLEFTHATLKDKARKVLNMLQTASKEEQAEGLKPKEALPAVNIELPDLIDTTTLDSEKSEGENSSNVQADLSDHEPNSVAPGVVHNTLGDDPFADMFLHTPPPANGGRLHGDLFLGLSLDDAKVLDKKHSDFSTRDDNSLFEGLDISANEHAYAKSEEASGSLTDLVDCLTMKSQSPLQNPTGIQQMNNPTLKTSLAQHSILPIPLFNSEDESIANAALRNPGPPFMPSQLPSFVSSGVFLSPMMYTNPLIPMPSGIVGVSPSNVYMQHGFAHHNFGFPLSGAPFNQPQDVTGLPTSKRTGTVTQQQSGINGVQGIHGFGTGYDARFADGFDFTSNSVPKNIMGNSKKEEAKAFDFISDHVSAARGIKK